MQNRIKYLRLGAVCSPVIFLPEDELLLKHEYLELTLMKELGYTYEKAHEEANKKFNWAKAARKLKGYF